MTNLRASDLPTRKPAKHRARSRACSDACCRARHAALALALLWPPAALWPAAAGAKVFLETKEALALAFPPPCEILRRTVFLTPEQLERASELAGERLTSALIHPYEARCEGERSGTAYFDTHRVRTLPETLMVAIDRDGNLWRTEILVFREPEEYIPRDIWYEQFEGQALDDALDLKRKIRSVTGATLTARATTDAVRRVMAIHQVLTETVLTEAALTETALTESQRLERQPQENDR